MFLQFMSLFGMLFSPTRDCHKIGKLCCQQTEAFELLISLPKVSSFLLFILLLLLVNYSVVTIVPKHPIIPSIYFQVIKKYDK